MGKSYFWTFLLLILVVPVIGSPVISVDTNFDSGVWTYDYTVDNTGGSFDIDFFELTGLADDVTAAAWPDDWNFAWSPGGIAQWETPVWTPISDAIEAGESLSGFILTSTAGPADVDYFVQGVTGFDEGKTQGPVTQPIPEAPTMALFGMGILALFGYIRRRET